MTLGAIILAVAFLVPISAGAQQSADCVGVYDADGARIGRVGGYFDWAISYAVGGRAITVGANNNGFKADSVFYTDANCSSAPWLGAHNYFGGRSFDGTTIIYPDPDAADSQISVQSRFDNTSGVCLPFSTLAPLVPALQFPLPAFTLPFHLEPEACFVPPAAVAALGPRSLLAMALVLAFGAVVTMRRTRLAAGARR